ncbi:Serine 3-dehydrogenase [Saliniradius amylolyticus]|uniref:Serine 3-dehydrogenase n=1 Tax=Saliniradius amylolyticus TaxID=2183582 RepID=A0A2S2E4S0_9ALTE|nr:SDR family NAD(P)-dependent oxidoreductase [Saliniradius amylolyticus]AWL12656.1 Serine 3-dehydrogenase [Saliniradius amylolyticus]
MKTILITGASSGIGKALAVRAASQGWQVIACGRNEERLEALTGQEPNITPLSFDVSDNQQCKQALENVNADVYVLNAGTCEYVDVDNWDTDLFRRVFEPNFFGLVNTLDPILPKLKSGNQLVIVDSLARCLPFTRSQAYGASKAAAHYLTKSLAVDLAGRGIIVQSVSPGFVKTPLTEQNDFDMPMRISAERAAKQFLTGIERRSSSIYFPTLFAWLMRLFAKLPTALQVALSKGMK